MDGLGYNESSSPYELRSISKNETYLFVLFLYFFFFSVYFGAGSVPGGLYRDITEGRAWWTDMTLAKQDVGSVQKVALLDHSHQSIARCQGHATTWWGCTKVTRVLGLQR